MRLPLISTFLAANIATLIVGDVGAEQICRPRLTIKHARLSELQELERKWTARLDIDASRCTTTHGRFEIIFAREKENAPELEFTEQFKWQTGPLQTAQIEVSIDFWIDEAVQHYAIGTIAPCPCRE
jgi:hypothetical protein